MLKKWSNKLLQNRRRLLVGISVVTILVIGGIIVLSASHAATPYASFESENGSLSGGASVISDTTASGGKAIQFSGGTGTTANSGPLPFTLPAQSVLKSSGRKVFAHFFAPYPISFDNKDASSDYYATSFLTINGEGGSHAAYGGFLRERPLPRAVSTSPTWQVDDMQTEVKQASEAGLDGFTVDILGTSGANWDRIQQLLQAIPKQDPNFKIILMPDATGTGVQAGAASFAGVMANLQKTYGSSLYHLADGRLVISPFYPENAATGVAYWTTFLNTMKNTYGIDVAFVPCFLDDLKYSAQFASISYGFSRWGSRTPAANTTASINSYIDDAHKQGKIWMQPVSVQDTRPYSGSFVEAGNTENYRDTWNGAISGGSDGKGAEWVQIPTWNDYSENAQIAPSTHIGWSPLDIGSYYLTRFKTGSWPAITKNVLYLSHRVQPWAAQPSPLYATTMTSASSSSITPPRDTVEVLSFLKSAQTVQVTVGGNNYTYSAPAGVSAKLEPLATGNVSTKIVTTVPGDAAQAVSPFPVTSSRPIQDENYYFTSSAR